MEICVPGAVLVQVKYPISDRDELYILKGTKETGRAFALYAVGWVSYQNVKLWKLYLFTDS